MESNVQYDSTEVVYEVSPIRVVEELVNRLLESAENNQGLVSQFTIKLIGEEVINSLKEQK